MKYKITLLLLFVNALITNNLDADRAEDVLEKLSLEEKIGQLFIVPACQLREEDHQTDLNRLVQEMHVGGIILKQGKADGQIALINHLQSKTKVPLLCVADAEWGLAMRLSDTLAFPKNLTLGAVQDERLLFLLGQEIGRQCQRVGINVNFAPVVDVNSNPKNPLIHMRSFGEDPQAVAGKAVMVMHGMQSMGIFACAKHFPGHGDTVVDSHVDLPIVNSSLERLWELELIPFQQMVENQVAAVMSSHLCFSKICPDVPATFSSFVIEELLRKKLQFQGLVFTDALNMQALSRYSPPEEIGIRALLAGHDLLLYGDHIAPNVDQILRRDVPEAIAGIKKAISNGLLREETLNQHVLRILRAKEKLYLFERKEIPRLASTEELFPESAISLKRDLYRQALTLLGNEQNLLSLSEKEAKIILICDEGCEVFLQKMNERFSHVTTLAKGRQFANVDEGAIVIAGAIPEASREFSSDLLETVFCYQQKGIPVAWVVFGTPYSLENLPFAETVILAYEAAAEAQEAAADAICGILNPVGQLPVNVPGKYTLGAGKRP